MRSAWAGFLSVYPDRRCGCSAHAPGRAAAGGSAVGAGEPVDHLRGALGVVPAEQAGGDAVGLGLVVAGLVYAGYFWGAGRATVGSRLELFHRTGMLNRTFVACTVCLIGLISQGMGAVAGPIRRRVGGRGGADTQV